MEIRVSRGNMNLNPQTVDEMEEIACKEVSDSVEYFHQNNVRFGPEGLYLKASGKVHLFQVAVTFVRTLTEEETKNL